jgi:hypothetical protein
MGTRRLGSSFLEDLETPRTQRTAAEVAAKIVRMRELWNPTLTRKERDVRMGHPRT